VAWGTRPAVRAQCHIWYVLRFPAGASTASWYLERCIGRRESRGGCSVIEAPRRRENHARNAYAARVFLYSQQSAGGGEVIRDATARRRSGAQKQRFVATGVAAGRAGSGSVCIGLVCVVA